MRFELCRLRATGPGCCYSLVDGRGGLSEAPCLGVSGCQHIQLSRALSPSEVHRALSQAHSLRTSAQGGVRRRRQHPSQIVEWREGLGLQPEGFAILANSFLQPSAARQHSAQARSHPGRQVTQLQRPAQVGDGWLRLPGAREGDAKVAMGGRVVRVES